VGDSLSDLHLFEAGGLKLAFAPATDGLFLLDEAGWETVRLARSGLGLDSVSRRVAAAHGPAAASACLEELEALRAACFDPIRAELDGSPAPSDPDGPGGRPNPDGAGRVPAPRTGWLPSTPDRPLLKALCLNVAHDCDLACRYCFAGQGGFGGRRGLMSAAVARAAVDILLEHSGDVATCEIDFFGGEPLLNLDVVRETVDYADRQGAELGKSFSFTLTTNAFALGPDEAGYLNEAMANVVLSLDGRPRVHDRMRPATGGAPTHDRVLSNIRRFVAQRGDRDYWVRGTYTAHNLDFSRDFAYLAEQGFRNISLEPVVGGTPGPTGSGQCGGPCGETGRWGLGEEHLEDVAREYVRLADIAFELAAAGRRVNFFHFITEDAEGPCFAKRVRGCGAGREYMAVTPEGDLYPCHQFVGREGFRVGNVVDGRLRPSGPAADVARLWLGSKAACRDCWARYRCSGGCHANAHAATGDLSSPDPLGCALLKARLEAALYLQARLARAGL